jgi:GAF domain-containing protein
MLPTHKEEAMSDARANRTAQLSHLINGTLNLDEVFERTLEQARLLTGGERAAIILAQGEKRLRCQAAVGMECMSWESVRFEFAQRLAQQVLQEQRARLTSDAQVDQRPDLARSIGIQSILCAPLLSSGHSIGVLYVERRLTLGVFTADDLERLELIATHGAVAIENARR